MMCATTKEVWYQLTDFGHNLNDVINKMDKENVLRNDEYIAKKVFEFYLYITNHDFFSFVPGLVEYINAHSSITQYRTPSILLVLAYYLYSNQFVSHSYSVNKYMYKLNRLGNGSMSFDISTCKLWYAMVLVTKKEYLTYLKIVNEVLSTIPPYACLLDLFSNNASNESKRLYENKFYSSTRHIRKERGLH